MVIGAFLPLLKGTADENIYPPSNGEVKNEWSNNSLPHVP
jgi:hypothetical protein